MNQRGQLWYGTDLLAQVESVQDLTRILSDIKKNFRIPNPALDLIFSDDTRLIIGLSPKWCWLHYMDEKTGYYFPKNQNNEDGTAYFMYDSHYTEAYLRNCVDFDTVVKVASEFFSTGNLPALIEWEELK